MPARRVVLALLALCVNPLAQAPVGSLDPAGVSGTRILGGGGKLPDGVYERFLALAGGAAAKIVLIPTASESVDDPKELDAVLQRWRTDHPGHTFTVLHTRDRATADREDFTAPLRAATGVWLGGGAQQRLAEAYLGTRVERELHALLQRGGVLGGTSAGTAIQTRTMIQEGMDPPIVATGFDLLPGAVVDQHFLKRGRLPRLRTVLREHPGLFGLGIDEGTAVEVHGRELRVHGVSKALLLLPATAGRDERLVELVAGESGDLLTWQRAAHARTATPWPPTPARPEVPRGALILVGGGPLPPEAVARFVELAGGVAAKVVLVPSAAPADARTADPIEAALRAAGAEVRVLDCSHPTEVSAERLAVLADATAVWFGGGRQWRLVDAFAGTAAIAAFHAVLARGGVIGGSSAGATIQADFLVRGNPLGNAEEWCEGYDQGFGFLPGCAVDQHFLVRNRTADLCDLVHRLPWLIGVGIDEGTAAIVRGGDLEVVGRSKVAIVDARASVDHGPRPTPEPTWLAAGDHWDLPAGRRR